MIAAKKTSAEAVTCEYKEEKSRKKLTECERKMIDVRSKYTPRKVSTSVNLLVFLITKNETRSTGMKRILSPTHQVAAAFGKKRLVKKTPSAAGLKI